ncbi:hypothetical protein [sulfur-oxidizing endosymbiont of Gigantopelta aegis]|uniref:hypothetical protein n=1 Tax=sulfur-oxidizing endosymbiont of Gigantopelta aegis TaxID=2794934 RepID=UPI0018DBADB5|nr:hypothetical protein [sulfur-oxidizing endosymbiont of Gigantopelta aegis]
MKKELNGPQALKLKQLHNVFMMIDKYPDNENRFDFDAVKFERDVRLGKLTIVS